MIRGMNTDKPSHLAEPAEAHHPGEQLSLLPPSAMPLQFRLSRATRERGLAHIAAIRQQLASRRQHKAA